MRCILFYVAERKVITLINTEVIVETHTMEKEREQEERE